MYTILRDYDIPTYYELETMLLEHGECCLVGTTGVGKTRISMGFVKNYKLNTLVISDRNAINKSWEKHAEESGVFTISTVTMQSFHKAYKMLINGFDLYIFDEAHHLGGNEWYNTYMKFKQLISKECFIIGLTATSKRYFDKEGINDITESIFNGHVVYAMSRKEAVDLGIIGRASYVYALYDTTEFSKKYRDKEMADDLRCRLDWAIKNQPQVSDILLKHAPEGNKKGIVYVDRIKSIDDGVRLIGMTFPKEPIWYIHSKMPSAEIRRITEEFAECKSGFIVNVDMVSEGIHYDGINIIIMLRRTISPNKLIQQAGRASNSDEAIIFDLVGNRTSIKKTLERMNNFIKRKPFVKGANSKTNNHPTLEAVIVADYASDFLKILEEIDNSNKRYAPWSIEELEILKNYYPIEGGDVYKRLPGRTYGTCCTKAYQLHIKCENGWSQEEDEILKKYYPTEGTDVCKRLPGRTRDACMTRAGKIGIYFNNRVSYLWTSEEDEILKKYYPTEGTDVCKRLPGRTKSACQRRADKLCINDTKSPWKHEEDEILRKYYPTEGCNAFKRLPERTIPSCRSRMRRLGIKAVSSSSVWSSEEDEILREYYSTEGPDVYKRLPGRTKRACISKAIKLGLKYNK